MTTTPIQGSCLCGAVAYEVIRHLGIFQYCHCSRCRKFTGSAHSANLLVAPDQFRWTQGAELVGYYALPNTRHFATAFCRECGSSLPWQAQSGKAIVVPAGSLDDDPGILPTGNVFYASRACWYKPSSELPSFDELPPK